jgi:hypothetical protein
MLHANKEPADCLIVFCSARYNEIARAVLPLAKPFGQLVLGKARRDGRLLQVQSTVGAKVTLDLRHLLRRRQARETGGGNTRGWQKPRGHNFVAPGVDSAASSRSSSVTSSSSYRRSAGSSATHRCLHSGRNQIGLPLRSRSVRNTCRVN